MRRILIIGVLLVVIVTPDTTAQVHDRFDPLHPGSVHLDGYLESDIRKSINNWQKKLVPYDIFADFFSDGRPYRPVGLPLFAAGEMWGKAVRSGSMYYRYTQDPKLKEILDSTVTRLLAKERGNGSISCSTVRNQPDGKSGDLWERKYVLLALDRYYEYVNRDRQVLESMIRQADCILSQIGPALKVRIVDQGWSPNHIESSTLLEPIMRLYNHTGDKRYLDFATYIVEEGGAKGYNLINEALNNVEPHRMAGGIYPKAYEMMSFFEGLTEYYRVTGDDRIKQAIINLYNSIRTKEITITGNGGGDAPWHSHGECWDNTWYEQTNSDMTRMMETCVGVTWLKFCSQVFRLTGDPSAGDEMERYIYNGLIGALKPSGDKFSYMNMLNGVKSDPSGWGANIEQKGAKFTCCDLNGPMGLAYIPYVAMMNSGRGPVINLYNTGEFHINSPMKQKVQITLDTDFPVSGKVKIGIHLAKTEEFDIHLRMPFWSEKTEIKLDGKLLLPEPGTFETLHKAWEDGDVIEVDFDLRCRIINSPKGDGYQALIRGPVVLARDENLDLNYAQPVEVISENGYVDVIKEEPFYETVRLQFKVPTKDGYIRMVDYASSDNWNGRHTFTWLPVK